MQKWARRAAHTLAENRTETATARSWSEDDTLTYLRQTRSLAQNIIRMLSDMSQFEQPPLPLPVIRHELSNSPIELPNLGSPLAPHEIDIIIDLATQHDYGAKSTREITSWMRRLPQHHHVRSVNTINRMIGYFISLNDLKSANFWVKYLFQNNIKPDRATMHLLLRDQARRVHSNPYPSPMHPLIRTENTLGYMHRQGNVYADADTWNYVLQNMPFGFGKSFVVEEMGRQKIELSSESLADIAEVVVESQPAAHIGSSLIKSVDPNDPHVLRTVVSKLLTVKAKNNENVRRAWSLVVDSECRDTSIETLNVFLKSFASRAALHFQFGVLAHFSDTKWNDKTWEHFLEGASFTRETVAKYTILGTILKQMERERIILTSRGKFLARRAMERSQKYGFSFNDLGVDGWQKLRNGLAWCECFEAIDPQMLADIGFADSQRTLPFKRTMIDASRFTPVEKPTRKICT